MRLELPPVVQVRQRLGPFVFRFDAPGIYTDLGGLVDEITLAPGSIIEEAWIEGRTRWDIGSPSYTASMYINVADHNDPANNYYSIKRYDIANIGNQTLVNETSIIAQEIGPPKMRYLPAGVLRELEIRASVDFGQYLYPETPAPTQGESVMYLLISVPGTE